MKRHNEDGVEQVKRPKLEDTTAYIDQPRRSSGTQAYSDSSVNGSATEKELSATLLAHLESILSQLAIQQHEVKAILGLDAQEHMKSLLNLLKGRSGSISIDTYYPAKLDIPGPSPLQSKTIRPFDANAVPSRPFTLPDLPPILPGPYVNVPFIHRSVAPTDPITGAALPQKHKNKFASPFGKTNSPTLPSTIPQELNYERLEFLGDSHLSTIASHLIYSRFSYLAPGRQTTLRSNLVNNETLMHFSRAYGFDKKVQINDSTYTREQQSDLSRGNKGFNKILADVFEAYVAAVILSDPDNGWKTVEKWLSELWTPILLECQSRNFFGPVKAIDYASFLPYFNSTQPQVVDEEPAPPTQYPTPIKLPQESMYSTPEPLPTNMASLISGPGGAYDPNAKAVLQKRIAPNNVRLTYRPAQSKRQMSTATAQTFTIAVHLTGWGHTDLRLGVGTGTTKVEAGNRAAMDAMENSKEIVEDCERRFNDEKRRRDEEKEEKWRQKKERFAMQDAAADADEKET